MCVCVYMYVYIYIYIYVCVHKDMYTYPHRTMAPEPVPEDLHALGAPHSQHRQLVRRRLVQRAHTLHRKRLKPPRYVCQARMSGTCVRHV
jgi:hypothetical protein